MKTIAYTGGLNLFRKYAVKVAQRFEKLNEIETRVLDDYNTQYLRSCLKDPAWIKAFLWQIAPPDTERVLWIDADMIPLRPMLEVPEHPFSAVPNGIRGKDLANVFPMLQWFEDYFNGGFFVATRVTEAAFRLLQSFMFNIPARAWSMYEQSWLNVCILAAFKRYYILPDSYNWSVKRHHGQVPDDVIMLHYPGMGWHERGPMLDEAWAKYEKELPA